MTAYRDDLHAGAMDVAQRLAHELMNEGATAVVLTGSFARGLGGPESDIDLLALGVGPAYELRRAGDFLVSVSFRTVENVRAEFLDPVLACTCVPGWRSAIILADSAGEAAALQSDAVAWEWDEVRERAQQWVAEEVTGLAEEVHKLAARATEPDAEAAAIAAFLAMRLPLVACVLHERLYGSDSARWDTAAEGMGRKWAVTQSMALGLDDAPLVARVAAALELYARTADATWHLLSERQREVVLYGAALAQEHRP